LLLATQSAGQDLSEFETPTTRYIRENANLLTLSYWPEEVSFEAVGDVPLDLGFQSASSLQVFSEMAEASLKMVGEPDSWFTSKTSVGQDANYVVVFGKLKGAEARNAEIVYIGRDFDLNVENARPEVRQILASGLKAQGPGCFASWKASDENEIKAFVLVVDTENSVQQQKACIDWMIPSSLGVLPVFTTPRSYEITGEKTESDEPFVDESELVFLLRASAYCRNTLGDYSLQCPVEVLGTAYRHHTRLLQNAEDAN